MFALLPDRQVLDRLAEARPEIVFAWADIEDDAEFVGDIDVESFPTLAVFRAGQALHGPDLVVAAEKAGLVYGHMNIFHRLVDNHPELGPVFSVANLVKPGSFDMAHIQDLRTPGISFFMALPGPLPALDAWDAMLPTAQRMAELLDGVLLDEERNALGRQRIAHIREDLRNYDRKQTKWDLRTTR